MFPHDLSLMHRYAGDHKGPPNPTSAALAPTDVDGLVGRVMPIGRPQGHPYMSICPSPQMKRDDPLWVKEKNNGDKKFGFCATGDATAAEAWHVAGATGAGDAPLAHLYLSFRGWDAQQSFAARGGGDGAGAR